MLRTLFNLYVDDKEGISVGEWKVNCYKFVSNVLIIAKDTKVLEQNNSEVKIRGEDECKDTIFIRLVIVRPWQGKGNTSCKVQTNWRVY